MPLSGLSIGAVGDRVVVKQGASRWQAESGQYLLAFEGDPDAGSLKIVERLDTIERRERAPSGTSSEPSRSPHTPRSPELDAMEWFDRGAALETENAGE